MDGAQMPWQTAFAHPVPHFGTFETALALCAFVKVLELEGIGIRRFSASTFWAGIVYYTLDAEAKKPFMGNMHGLEEVLVSRVEHCSFNDTSGHLLESSQLHVRSCSCPGFA